MQKLICLLVQRRILGYDYMQQSSHCSKNIFMSKKISVTPMNLHKTSWFGKLQISKTLLQDLINYIAVIIDLVQFQHRHVSDQEARHVLPKLMQTRRNREQRGKNREKNQINVVVLLGCSFDSGCAGVY